MKSLNKVEQTGQQDYNNFHRIDIHQQLRRAAFEAAGEGPPCTLRVNHKAVDLDAEAGRILFGNGETASADFIVAADGIRVCLTPKELTYSSG